MSSRLQEILAVTRRRVTAQKEATPATELESRARAAPPASDLANALRRPGKRTAAAGPLRVLAELKRRSPSAGSIYDGLDPLTVARSLVEQGCEGLSVLTEPEFFGGSLETLAAVRDAVDVPLLRKDFIVESYQVLQARAFGADAVLLLAAALDDDGLRRCADTAREWGLSVLAEAHGEEELDRILALDLPLIGVNARDLNTFEVDVERSLGWARAIPADKVVVAESGVLTRADVDRVAAAPVDAVLVGQGLMREGRIIENYRELFGARS